MRMSVKRAPFTAALIALLGGTAPSIAQTSHGGMDHSSHSPGMQHAPGMTHDLGIGHAPGAAPTGAGPSGASVLTEPGQGAFAALSEVVRVLEADPATDWSKVDLDGLRDHLRDMDRLVSDAAVRTEDLADGLRMSVTGDADTIATVRRMVPAHAAELARDERWRVEAATTDEGAMLTVTSDDPATVARIKGLGFFGLMASQDHHREHHLMMALGRGPHAH